MIRSIWLYIQTLPGSYCLLCQSDVQIPISGKGESWQLRGRFAQHCFNYCFHINTFLLPFFVFYCTLYKSALFHDVIEHFSTYLLPSLCGIVRDNLQMLSSHFEAPTRLVRPGDGVSSFYKDYKNNITHENPSIVDEFDKNMNTNIATAGNESPSS